MPQKLISLSRKVDECKPLILGSSFKHDPHDCTAVHLFGLYKVDSVGRCRLTLSNPR
jgi:hypothetical protein